MGFYTVYLCVVSLISIFIFKHIKPIGGKTVCVCQFFFPAISQWQYNRPLNENYMKTSPKNKNLDTIKNNTCKKMFLVDDKMLRSPQKTSILQKFSGKMKKNDIDFGLYTGKCSNLLYRSLTKWEEKNKVFYVWILLIFNLNEI